MKMKHGHLKLIGVGFMNIPAKNEGQKYTYGDYLTWDDEQRLEIIDGLPYMMTAPSWEHQALLVELSTQFHNYLVGKSCQVFVAPFDVRLPYSKEKDENTQVVLQPDLVVICDRSKLKGTGCFGAPDLVVEIVSPASGKIDRILKFNQYERAGVKEYWILDPDERVLTVFKLGENGKYGRPEVYSDDDKLRVGIFENLEIDLQRAFKVIIVES
jgi:Uma2 family endonuclease